MGKDHSANLNDRVRNDLDGVYGKDYEVFVEGVGQEVSPTRVVMTSKKDGHKHEFKTTVTLDEFYRMVAAGVKHE